MSADAVNVFPVYGTAIIFPTLAFPSWVLCIPPLVWHFSQRNIAAWSLILWVILINFFNSINPLIWPTDNIPTWYNGDGLCDIEVRVFVGSAVALPACTTMIMRKLAKVMDTRNITIAPSRNERIREKVLEILWCWGYPALMMVVYYIVQPLRYYIFAISGCVPAYNLSWACIVFGQMWTPITLCFSAYYAGILMYRLYRYRREFHRLISARKTTKSRFVRLFIMALLLILAFLPYSFWLLWLNARQLNEHFSWDYVHGPHWNSVEKVPTQGLIRIDKWGQIATGYVAFFTFGTGTDAKNTYKKMLCAIGLGYIFPSLYQMSESGDSTASSFTTARGWCSSAVSKAKSFLSKNTSVTETLPTLQSDIQNNSMKLDAVGLSSSSSTSIEPVSTNEPILPSPPQRSRTENRSVLGRLFTRGNRNNPILPIHARSPDELPMVTEKSLADPYSSASVYSKAWASDSPTELRPGEGDGTQNIYVAQQLYQQHQEKDES